MCGRFALASPKAELITHFGLDDFEGDGDGFPARYNIPPGTDIAAIRQSPEGKRVLHRLRWGLIPHWSKDPSIGAKLNNARGETVHEKPSFKSAFAKRRCLIPVSGFFRVETRGEDQATVLLLQQEQPPACPRRTLGVLEGTGWNHCPHDLHHHQRGE